MPPIRGHLSFSEMLSRVAVREGRCSGIGSDPLCRSILNAAPAPDPVKRRHLDRPDHDRHAMARLDRDLEARQVRVWCRARGPRVRGRAPLAQARAVAMTIDHF